MGHQAGISILNQAKPAGLLTGEGDLGWGMGKADRKPLRKQDSGHDSDHLGNRQGDGAWYLGRWGRGSPRSLKYHGDGFRLVQETTMTEQAGPTMGVMRRNKKRQMIPYKNDYAFELVPKVGKATKLSWETVWSDLFCLEVDEKQNLQFNRKDPPPQKTDSTTENFLFQIPAFQRMKNKDHCTKSIAACLGVTLLA